ncbi:ribonuclease H-like domain-containing protein [Tanacetum coccineum]
MGSSRHLGLGFSDLLLMLLMLGLLIVDIIASLHSEFSMTDLNSLNYFLGDSVTSDSLGMFLSHCKYAAEILERAHMVSCNPRRTPVDTEYKLGDDGDPVSDLTLYQSLAGSIQYNAFTRSEYSVEAKYRGVANVVAETCWLRNLLLVTAGLIHIESRKSSYRVLLMDDTGKAFPFVIVEY